LPATLSRRGVAIALVASLTITLASALPAVAQPYKPAPVQQERIVKGEVVQPATAQTGATGKSATMPAPVWPGAKTTEVSLGGSTSNRAAKASGTPVSITAAGKPLSKVKVETFDRAKSRAAGVDGLLFRVSGGQAKISVDYSGFRFAYGGDWAARLRLTALPECALTTPDKPECQGTVLKSHNDVAKGTVSTDDAIPTTNTLMALAAGTSSGSGTYSATSLAPSATWAGGGNAGAFTWNYPLRTPPSLGGPAPALELAYSSASVDGRTSASNNQPSWVGQGFELSSNFVERRYTACSEDMANGARNTVKTGDLCWANENATLAMSGHAGELIKDPSVANRWRLRKDDGTYVEHRTGLSNGAKDGEHWVVTTTDGTQYWFGRSTQSTLTVPVAGNHQNEPCAQNAFSDSFCTQAYRWSLDYVLDLHGNTMSYTYAKETNKYGRNGSRTDLADYDRSTYLTQIDYGTRVDRAETAPMQVAFETQDRCSNDCGVHDATHWTDVPWDLACETSPCNSGSPSFWTTKRLASVTTKVAGSDVEKWTFGHTYPDPGDGTRAGLWLDKISHVGLANQSSTPVPDITFAGIQLSNRVDTHSDQLAAMKWWRLKTVFTETGGRIDVTYSAPDCVPGSRMPDANNLHDNTLRCYPVRWKQNGAQEATLDYFHKYVVTSVTEADLTGGAPQTVTNYDYLGTPAWHYTDDDGLIKADDKTWSVWRGYGAVRTTKGIPGEQTLTETRFFRGMHGDKTPTGTRNVSLPAITAGNVPAAVDEDAFAGMQREEITYNGPGGDEVSATVDQPWQSPPTATRTINDFTVHARHTGTAATHTRTTLDGGRGYRTTSASTVFDDTYGMVTRSEDLGDDAVTGDEKCTLTDYARNTGTWLIKTVFRTRSYVVNCATAQAGTGLADDDIVSDDRTYYDGGALGAAPTKGNVTTSEMLKSNTNGVPAYRIKLASEFDAYGRPTKTADIRGATTFAYTPSTGGPVTKTVTTNPVGWTTSTTVDPALQVPTTIIDIRGQRTDVTYDGLGRTTAVWLPGRDKATATASKSFAYLMRNNAPNAVTSKELGPNGNYITSYALFDGLLRPRQSQQLEASGRTTSAAMTDTYYDSVGRTARTTGAYLASAAPGTELFRATDTVPRQTTEVYDGAGRTIASIVKKDALSAGIGGQELYRTTSYYAGDRTDSTPPSGGTVTSVLVDTKGRTSELRQYHAGVAAGSASPAGFDATKYTYDRPGRLKTVIDSMTNTWEYGYDLLGRTTHSVDPDSGTTTSTYDDADQLATTTDANGDTLAYTYDTLGRKTSLRDGSATGPKRAEWTYDQFTAGYVVNDQPVKSIRYATPGGTDAYVKEIVILDVNQKPSRVKYSVPATEANLKGDYTYDYSYAADGSLSGTRTPALGDTRVETSTYTYDAFGQPTGQSSSYGVADPTPIVASTGYTSFGEVGAYALAGIQTPEVYVNKTYDQTTRRLEQIWTTRATGPVDVAKFQYTYDEVGNVTKVADTLNGDNQCFRTDYLRRMSEAWTPASGDCKATPSVTALGGPSKYWQSYTYNSAGDRTQLVDHVTTAGVRTTTYTPVTGKHSVASTTTTDNAGTRTASYGYNAAGATRTRPTASNGTQTMTWDAEKHLVSSADTSGQTTFVYDADGNRMIRRDPTGKTLYLPGQELRYTTATGMKTCTRYYSHAGQVIGVRKAAAVSWLSSDHHGTAGVTIDSTNDQTVGIRRYLPFGEERAKTGTWLAGLDKGFVGGTEDNTGLTHLGAREYDAALGRFVSVDPVMDLTDPQQWNGYAYSNNSPFTFSDPTGLWCDGCNDGKGWTTEHGEECVSNCGDSHNSDDPGQEIPVSVGSASKAYSNPASCSQFGYHVKDACVEAQTYRPSEPMSKIDLRHFVLDLWGLIPGYGEPADIANCALYAQEGSYGDAALSCAGAVPLAGMLATAAKWAKNSIKAASKVCSFEGDTLVLMSDGSSKPIRDVQPGDKVANSEPESEDTEAHEVVEVHVTDADKDYVDLTVATPDGLKTITTTANHPFYSASAGTWIDAAALEPGDQLNSPGNGRVGVDGVRSYTTGLRMYNLSVETIHAYYVVVGSASVLVHNTCSKLFEGDGFQHVLHEHVPGSPGVTQGNTLFSDYFDEDEIGELIKEASEVPGIPNRVDPNTSLPRDGTIHTKDFGYPVGSNGERKVEVILNPDGSIRTAYPVGR
jgi:RHS repeat-associated protein